MRTAQLSCLALLFAGASAAHAQPSADGQGPRPRIGLELGLGLQGGEIQCESEGNFCNVFTEAGGLNLNGAYFLNRRFGIAVDLWVMSHREADFTFNHYVNTVGIKWRPAPILTISAGVGSAHASLDYNGVDTAQSDDAFAIMGAAALDLIRARRWALSVEARFGTGFYGDSNNNNMADVVGRNVGIGAVFTVFGF